MRFEKYICWLGVLVIGSLFSGNLYAGEADESFARRVVHVEKRDFRYDNGRFATTPATGTKFLFDAEKLELVELRSVMAKKSDVCDKDKCGCNCGGTCSCCESNTVRWNEHGGAYRLFRRCR